ncbi:protein shisa-5 isoform X1 [Manacus vitellinus]|uniref:protein shisa-5 isoform X1 n=1 Tax=Manacus vitellinus TaxID=328815 RepID=UPI00115C928D|nr:protein shisa-5 isoform X1 [Manacus vitellinus]
MVWGFFWTLQNCLGRSLSGKCQIHALSAADDNMNLFLVYITFHERVELSQVTSISHEFISKMEFSCYRIPDSDLGDFQDPDDDLPLGLSFGTLIAIGVTVCAVIVITLILCLTCSCCCLYKACRRPRPVVTTTATTTVVHAPYPQQPAVPPSYPAAPYQGYQPVAIQPQPGMPVAPYPAQYPPPYPMQPSGPPAYHETVAAGAGAPYPSQPPYNPAYMDPQKPTY